MGRPKKEVAVETEPQVEDEPIVKTKEFTVLDHNGTFVRVYSTELHGKDAQKLAEIFAKKIGGKIV